MGLICITGDNHGSIYSLYVYLQELEKRINRTFDCVISVGDFGIYTNERIGSDWLAYWSGRFTAPIPTYVCMGNHEDWSSIQDWRLEPDRVKNISLLEDGQITEVCGLKVGCIWGNFSPKSWANPELVANCRNYTPQAARSMHIYKPSVERLQAAGAFDVLITHDRPANVPAGLRQPSTFIKQQLGLTSDEPALGCEGINRLWETSGCRYSLWGHIHTFYRECRLGLNLIQLHCFQYNKEQSVFILDTDDMTQENHHVPSYLINPLE